MLADYRDYSKLYMEHLASKENIGSSLSSVHAQPYSQDHTDFAATAPIVNPLGHMQYSGGSILIGLSDDAQTAYEHTASLPVTEARQRGWVEWEGNAGSYAMVTTIASPTPFAFDTYITLAKAFDYPVATPQKRLYEDYEIDAMTYIKLTKVRSGIRINKSGKLGALAVKDEDREYGD